MARYFLPARGYRLGVPFILCLLGLYAFAGCASKDVTQCPLISADQRGSFLAKADATPLSLVVDSSFSHNEVNQILRAVSQWNSQGVRLQAGTFFSVATQNIPASVRSANPRDCTQTYGNASTVYVIDETSDTRWQALGMTNMNPGATIRCGSTSEVAEQIIFLNDHLMPQTQFMSIILHEMGHSLGLDHSCSDGAGSSSFVGCSGLSTSHPYHQAVMFPVLGASELKEMLMPNDNTRTQCYYGVY